ncbi:MAG: glycoside hydrolase family 3 C-terminal domain-containing protein [bacterium]|nr:glycoside hydrolase family 3 C-terminal domain-containing protein [bacterium]
MKKIISGITAVSILLSLISAASAEAPELSEVLPYQDTSLSFEERAADLVSRMTLEEKVAQTGRNAPAISRLGVHAYNYWREGIHGVARQGQATSFPSSLAMSNTWDTELMRRVMDITSTEARGKNNRYDLSYWNPTINMARDPRWGRNEESYGEDPFLTAALGSAAVEGMQGDDEKYIKVISTLKHFAANNCEGERQTGTSVLSERALREYYTKAFQDITEKSDPMSVMSSYNATTVTRNGETIIDYIASSANKYLLTDLLRRTWGFNGYVVGDCGAWENLFGRQSLRKKLFPDMPVDDITAAMAVSTAYNAGNNLDCGSRAQTSGYDAVVQGYTDEGTLDRAVYELFLARMKTGEFDDGAKYQDIKAEVIETDENVAAAEQAAEESWVLLENKNETLPLKKTDNIAVVGNLADELTLGDYSGEPTKTVKPFEGIEQEIKRVNPDAEVTLIGRVSDSTPLFDLKSITLELNDGKTRTVDLSKAENVRGMSVSENGFTDVTKSGSAIIRNVDFSNVKSVKAETAVKPGTPAAVINIGYSNATQTVAVVNVNEGQSEGEYTGASGGYNQTEDMYITISANAGFSVENYKGALESADYIIAYGGTTVADSSESNDRKSIDIPDSQAHVQQLCNAYPDKTVVVLSTVGQINAEPIKDKCAALLWTSYNGQTQGTALGKVLTGEVNPSGKLTTTWYASSDLEKLPIGSPREKIDGIDYNFTNYEIAQSENYPGRTYQYYGGNAVYPFGCGKSYTDFVYSNIQVSADSVLPYEPATVSADITNTGSVSGTETAQFYVSVPGADGVTYPLKQLKGFERVSLEPGETKTVSFEFDPADVSFFNEETLQNYIVNGEYTLRIGSSSADADCQSVTTEVVGNLSDGVKLVKAVPDGIKLIAAVSGDGVVQPANKINANASATLMNDKLVTDLSELKDTQVRYTSSNEAVAKVNANGEVVSGGTVGTAVITVSVTDGDKTVENSFPVVTEQRSRVSSEITKSYLDRLAREYDKLPAEAYTAENREILETIYAEAIDSISAELLEENLPKLLEEAVAAMTAVEQIVLENSCTLVSDTVKYGETKANQLTFRIMKDGSEIDPSGFTWTIEKLDASDRQAPEIDKTSGAVTVNANTVFKVTASNYADGECGSAVVHANLPINVSGTNWVKLDGIKLEKLIGFISSTGAQLSLNAGTDRLVGESNGAFAAVNRNEISKLNKDAYGCGTVYVKASGAAEISFEYIESDMDVMSMANGVINVSVPYESGVLIESRYDGGRLVSAKSHEITAAGDYSIEGCAEGEEIRFMLWKSISEAEPLTAAVTEKYTKPSVKTLTVFNFSDSAFDSFFETSEGLKLSSGTGMDGIGGWGTEAKKRSYSYNGTSYEFTRGLKAGSGNKNKSNVYFTPEADGVVTVLFDANTERKMMIEQDGIVKEQLGNGSGVLTPLAMKVKAGSPVYVYGGGSNKSLYAVIFDTNGEAAEATAAPMPTERTTDEPMPPIVYEQTVEFEDFAAKWDSGSNEKAETGASGGYVVENTRNEDIFYFGERDMNALEGIDLVAGVRDSAGVVTAEVYAADMTGIDTAAAAKADIMKLLTSENLIGRKDALVSNPSKWNDFRSNVMRVNSGKTGKNGIFVKLTTTGKYCGNIDYVKLMYSE